MKKIVFFLICFSLIACSSETATENQDFQIYTDIKQYILSKEEYDQTDDFRVNLLYHEMDNKYRYDIIINDPQVSMYHIVALCYNDEEDDKMCPSLGIFDDDEFHMKPGYVDKSQGFYKGIQLSGVSSSQNIVRLYISYYTDQEKTQKREFVLKVDENEIR